LRVYALKSHILDLRLSVVEKQRQEQSSSSRASGIRTHIFVHTHCVEETKILLRTTASLQHAQIESAEDSWPITIPMNNNPSENSFGGTQVCRGIIFALTTFHSSKGAKRIALRGHCLLIDHYFPTRTSDTADASLPISKLDC